jgi:hypothetical protein
MILEDFFFYFISFGAHFHIHVLMLVLFEFSNSLLTTRFRRLNIADSGFWRISMLSVLIRFSQFFLSIHECFASQSFYGSQRKSRYKRFRAIIAQGFHFSISFHYFSLFFIKFSFNHRRTLSRNKLCLETFHFL